MNTLLLELYPKRGDPPFKDACEPTLERELSGFSGCRVALFRQGSRAFVRKMSGTATYNARLMRQADAQEYLARQTGAPFRVPAILGRGEAEGLFFFDSEFVVAEDMIVHLARSPRQQVDNALEAMAKTIAYFAARRTPQPISVLDYAASKLHALNADLKELCSDEIGQALNWLACLKGTDRKETSLSHEDLTLENILVDRQGTLWLIDCLDSPHPHYWFSCAKIFQDLEGGWYRLHNPARLLDVATRIYARKRMMAHITAIDPDYPRVHYLLLFLHFLRILPYAQANAPAICDAILDRMHRCLIQLRASETIA